MCQGGKLGQHGVVCLSRVLVVCELVLLAESCVLACCVSWRESREVSEPVVSYRETVSCKSTQTSGGWGFCGPFVAYLVDSVRVSTELPMLSRVLCEVPGEVAEQAQPSVRRRGAAR